ncbi:alpha/beta fold hydrolase [Algihabitans albus]|uniref:alpha/beta fold hydrolase n=1 Tax=Algihabitans albus TaxID=2164067 RepID=UPI001ABD3CD5|nr:alpha/beta hydrolase [Algihabitans albus]
MSHHRIESGRALLAAEVAGEGAPVVFLHAAVTDRRLWRVELEGVGATSRAIAYDRRGFGETRAETEDYSSVADLMAVLEATAEGAAAILVGCSQGGRIAIDAAFRHPSRVRGLVLIAPSVTGAPEATYPPEIESVTAQLTEAEKGGDPERIGALKARLWLDGPLAPEGRVAGPARRLFHEMHSIVLRSPPVGSDSDTAPNFQRLSELSVPSLILWGDLDFPHIQERCRHMVAAMPRASGRKMTKVAHLPSLERPAEVTGLLTDFIDRCPGGRA